MAIYVHALPREHPPPHFHIVGPEFDVAVEIWTLRIMEGRCRPNDIAEALDWAALNIESYSPIGSGSMNGTEIVVDRVLPRIDAVTAVAPAKVVVTWSGTTREGATETVDLAPMLFAFKLYKPLRDDPGAFGSVHVAAHGSTIAWGEDEEIDMSAGAVEELAEQAMTTADFKAFLKRHGLTLEAAAAQLGIGRRLVAYYAGGRDIPRVIALACAHLDRPRERGFPRHAT